MACHDTVIPAKAGIQSPCPVKVFALKILRMLASRRFIDYNELNTMQKQIIRPNISDEDVQVIYNLHKLIDIQNFYNVFAILIKCLGISM